MIRGVNKYIIEVNNIKSDYFEKAILFVKNETGASDKKLDYEANSLIKKYELMQKNSKVGYLRSNHIKKKRKILFCGLATILLSVAVTALIIYLTI